MSLKSSSLVIVCTDLMIGLPRQRRRLFLQLRASFQVEKSFTFLKKNALRQAPFWQLTNDKRVASRFHNNKNNNKKEKIATDRTSFGAQGVHHPAGAPYSWNNIHMEAPYSFHNVTLPQTSLWTDIPSPLTSKPDISAAHSTRLPLQLLL